MDKIGYVITDKEDNTIQDVVISDKSEEGVIFWLRKKIYLRRGFHLAKRMVNKMPKHMMFPSLKDAQEYVFSALFENDTTSISIKRYENQVKTVVEEINKLDNKSGEYSEKAKALFEKKERQKNILEATRRKIELIKAEILQKILPEAQAIRDKTQQKIDILAQEIDKLRDKLNILVAERMERVRIRSISCYFEKITQYFENNIKRFTDTKTGLCSLALLIDYAIAFNFFKDVFGDQEIGLIMRVTTVYILPFAVTLFSMVLVHLIMERARDIKETGIYPNSLNVGNYMSIFFLGLLLSAIVFGILKWRITGMESSLIFQEVFMWIVFVTTITILGILTAEDEVGVFLIAPISLVMFLLFKTLFTIEYLLKMPFANKNSFSSVEEITIQKEISKKESEISGLSEKANATLGKAEQSYLQTHPEVKVRMDSMDKELVIEQNKFNEIIKEIESLSNEEESIKTKNQFRKGYLNSKINRINGIMQKILSLQYNLKAGVNRAVALHGQHLIRNSGKNAK